MQQPFFSKPPYYRMPFCEFPITLTLHGRHFLLTGGDKKGKNQDKFYKNLIAESEIIVERHEKELENEKISKSQL